MKRDPGSKSRPKYPPFRDIQIGEPDANAEYFSAFRRGESPIFLNTFFALAHFPVEEFKSGEKYIISGQKGTGKTSVLRYLETYAREQGLSTEFLIFKKVLPRRD